MYRTLPQSLALHWAGVVRARSQVENDRRASILWTVLAKVAAKRARRDLLADGSQTSIECDISAKIGRASFTDQFSGQLFVGQESTKASSSAPDADHVVALLLSELPEEQRARVVERIAKAFEKSGQLPDVDPKIVTHAAAWLKRLRAKVSQKVAGAVTFQLADE